MRWVVDRRLASRCVTLWLDIHMKTVCGHQVCLSQRNFSSEMVEQIRKMAIAVICGFQVFHQVGVYKHSPKG